MKTTIVLCPTFRHALYEWQRLTDTYPDMWVEVRRHPLSLTSKTGVKYVFRSASEMDRLKGFHGDVIRWDEVMP